MEWSTQQVFIYPDQNKIGEGNALDVRILDVNPIPTSKVTQAPALSGLDINDNKVRNPLKVRVKCVLQNDVKGAAEATLVRIKDMLELNVAGGKPVFSCILTHIASYRNLTLVEGPHRETIDSIDAYEFDLLFQEIILIEKKNDVAKTYMSPMISCGFTNGTKFANYA